MRWTIVLVIAAAALAAGAVWFASQADPDRAATPAQAASPKPNELRIDPGRFEATARQELTPEPIVIDRGDEANATTGGLVVRVSDDDDRPIVGATVELFREATVPKYELVTGERGEVVLADAEPGDRVDAHADGYAPSREAVLGEPVPAEVRLVLRRGVQMLRGRAVNDLGAPVAGARISFLRPYEWELWSVTDADGSFEIRDRPECARDHQDGVLTAAHPDYCYLADHSLEFDRGTNTALVRLYRWATLRIRVTDETGRLRGDAILSLSPDRLADPDTAFFMCGAFAGIQTRAEVDDGASHSTEHVPPLTSLWLYVQHPEFRTVERSLGSFSPGEDRLESVAFDHRIEPRIYPFAIVDPDGAPVAATVLMLQNDVGFIQRGLETDADGRFTVHADQPGSFTLTIAPTGFVAFRRKYPEDWRPAGVEVIELERSTATIDARVLDAAGHGIAGVTIKARSADDAMPVSYDGSTDADGTAHIAGVHPDVTYDLVYEPYVPGQSDDPQTRMPHLPYRPILYGVRPGGPPAIFRIVTPGLVRGRVVGDDLVGRTVRLDLVDLAISRDRPIWAHVCTVADDGTFRFPHLPPGPYRAFIDEAPGGGSFADPLRSLELAEGEAVDDLVLRPRAE